jgi:uncharacterized repeat protein (TIGR03806 family)
MSLGVHAASVGAGAAPYGLAVRTPPAAYLRMPHRGSTAMPALLSQTGAYADTRNLVPAKGLIPYDLVVAFWSDGAIKSRFAAIPAGKIHFSATGDRTFPKGTVFVKTFELATDANNPALKRRLETRLLVVDEDGGVYGVDYKWRADNSDADLMTSGLTEEVPLTAASGETHSQSWYYPSRQDCLTCHNTRANGVLGVKTRQMNHDFAYPGGTDNELRAWNHLGLFEPSFSDAVLASFDKLAAAADMTRSLEDRARSYLDANCSHCHRPGGTVANFDARYDTPLDQQELINGPVLIDQGIDKPRIISPHDRWRSIAFMRMDTTGDIRMPPLARNTIDEGGINRMREWIMSMPGRDVLAPPTLSPAGGTYREPIAVTLTVPEPGADIRYTLDGSVPGPSDLHYDKPILLTGPAVIRTRVYKEGFMRSIITQDVYVVGN